jgi:Fe-S-cluster-containing dehydrogenase component
MACPFGAPSYDPRAGVMSKCHLCAHRLDEERRPACVDACPTEALRLDTTRGDATAVDGNREVTPGIPGFADPARCEPGIRFVAPGGARRTRRLERLRRVL